ncbi:C40 family peptidase [Candidatus Uabimicrobium amorphum]|nr:C40 family peptidase [Candidatus Uabimicrobium amorphum]
MKVFVWIFLFVTSLHAIEFSETLAKNIQSYIKPLLEKNLAQKTQRSQPRLGIEFSVSENQMNFFLSRRSQRDTLFSVVVRKEQQTLDTNAVVLYPEEKQIIKSALRIFISEYNANETIIVGPIAWGISKKGVCNLYVEPRDEAGDNLASQLAFGTPLLILESNEDNTFFRVQGCSDGYLGWINSRDFRFVTQDHWDEWNASVVTCNTKEIMLKNMAIPAGGRFALLSYKGKTIHVRDFANNKWEFAKEDFSMYLSQQEKIIDTARKFLPKSLLATQKYLWGGTTTPQTDCSGFVQLTYRMHNILLPRDSDQQYQYSKKIKLENAQSGDLIFFSKHGKHPTHVGLHIDNDLFIHCSASGPYSGVKINSLSGESDYEKYLRKIYYASGRIK